MKDANSARSSSSQYRGHSFWKMGLSTTVSVQRLYA
jgi:hypothetical protein